MPPEQLVPSLKLCQRAQGLGYPQGKSYLVYNRLITGKIVVRDSISGELGRICDAPTLQEVLEKLAKDHNCYLHYTLSTVEVTTGYKPLEYTYEWLVGTHIDNPIKNKKRIDSNPVEAALQLWCELEERKVSNE